MGMKIVVQWFWSVYLFITEAEWDALLWFVIMSVYSGFATRQQEQRYNDCLEALLSALTKRLVKFYTQETCQEHKFVDSLIAIH